MLLSLKAQLPLLMNRPKEGVRALHNLLQHCQSEAGMQHGSDDSEAAAEGVFLMTQKGLPSAWKGGSVVHEHLVPVCALLRCKCSSCGRCSQPGKELSPALGRLLERCDGHSVLGGRVL